MRRSIAWAAILTWPLFPVWAETITCENTTVNVSTHRSVYANMACETVKKAEALFAQCNLPPLPDQVLIEIVDELKPGCVALYHCADDWIEVLEPSLMEPVRDPEGAFTFLPIEDYFQSVIVHELAHAALENTPCPFDACITANEYVAYTMQVMSLTPNEQLTFEANAGLDRKVSRDELSAVILYMAPHLFAQKAWTHLSQRDDPCGYIGQISDGVILLDVERF